MAFIMFLHFSSPYATIICDMLCFILKYARLVFYLRILNRIFAQNICLLLLIDINCFTFYRALFKIIGSKAENKLFQSGMDDNNVLIDRPITEVRPQGDLMVSVLLCENVTLKR